MIILFTVPSKEEMCLLLCLRSLTLMLDGEKAKAKEHLEALLGLKFDTVSSECDYNPGWCLRL